MPGSIIFKPIEAKLNHDSDWIGKMDPYCTFIVGDKRIKGEVCKEGGVNPRWNDCIAVPLGLQPTCVVELRDHNKLLPDPSIGAFVVNMDEIATMGQVSKWYPVFHNDKPAGEILIESTYSTATPVYTRTGHVKDELVIQDHGATFANIAQSGGMAGTNPLSTGLGSIPMTIGSQNMGSIVNPSTGTGPFLDETSQYKTSITGELKHKFIGDQLNQATGQFISPPTTQLNEGLYGKRARKHSDNPNVVATHLPGGGQMPL